jgi:ABC-type dipeptide/oligopeptide/nickel transport system permease subunit
VRTTTRQPRGALFVDAARVAGLPRRSILFRHIVPMTVPAALMQTATNMAIAKSKA